MTEHSSGGRVGAIADRSNRRDTQARKVHPSVSPRLGGFEMSVLVAIIHLEGLGYSVSIAEAIRELTGRSANLGAVYATLDRLEKKGLISSSLGDPTPERGGKPKRFYR